MKMKFNILETVFHISLISVFVLFFSVMGYVMYMMVKNSPYAIKEKIVHENLISGGFFKQNHYETKDKSGKIEYKSIGVTFEKEGNDFKIIPNKDSEIIEEFKYNTNDGKCEYNYVQAKTGTTSHDVVIGGDGIIYKVNGRKSDGLTLIQRDCNNGKIDFILKEVHFDN